MAEHREDVKARDVAAIEAGDFGNLIGEAMADMMSREHLWKFDIKLAKLGDPE